MGDPRKSNNDGSNLDFDTPRFFSDFPRIQVAPQRFTRDEEFKTLKPADRQELLERLIDRVREL